MKRTISLFALLSLFVSNVYAKNIEVIKEDFRNILNSTLEFKINNESINLEKEVTKYEVYTNSTFWSPESNLIKKVKDLGGVKIEELKRDKILNIIESNDLNYSYINEKVTLENNSSKENSFLLEIYPFNNTIGGCFSTFAESGHIPYSYVMYNESEFISWDNDFLSNENLKYKKIVYEAINYKYPELGDKNCTILLPYYSKKITLKGNEKKILNVGYKRSTNPGFLRDPQHVINILK